MNRWRIVNRYGVAASVVVLTLGMTAYVAGGPLRSGSRVVPGSLRSLEARVLDQSIDALAEMHLGDPNNYLIGHALADRYVRRFDLEADLADLERAESVARAALRFAPDRAAALARLSSLALARHEFEEALQAAKSAVESDSSDQSANAALFDAAQASGEHELLKNALGRLRPGSIARQLREARWLEVTGQPDEAFRTLSRACDELADSSVRRSLVAWCAARLGDMERGRSGSGVAARWYERALLIEPGYRNALEGLANIAYGREEWAEAAELYARIATDAHPDLYLRLAEVAEARGDAERRREHEGAFLRATAGLAGERMHARTLALYLVNKTEPRMRDRALGLARADAVRRPTAGSMTVLAWVHLQRGELPEALAASDRSLSRGVPGVTDHYVRGRLLEALGRRAEAADLLESATDDPGLLDFFAQQDVRTR